MIIGNYVLKFFRGMCLSYDFFENISISSYGLWINGVYVVVKFLLGVLLFM